MEELIEKICNEKNYDEILLEIQKMEDTSSIRRVLNEISNNNKLTQVEKNKYYGEIFDYIKDVNDNFKNKIKDIYFQGVKETILKITMLKKDLNDNKNYNDINIYEMTVFDFINLLSDK